MSEASRVVRAEKGKDLSPQSLHIRLRVLEVIVLLSLILNALQWYVAHANYNALQNRIDTAQTQPR